MKVPITATVAAYQRVGKTLVTIRRLLGCQPAPDEVLVHVDANQTHCADAIRAEFPDVPVLMSAEAVGPGGGRNKLIAAARNELVATFDDDSYPLDNDFFARAQFLMQTYPEAALITGAITHRNEEAREDRPVVFKTASFIACGVVMRRSAFLKVGGFVPLTIAYGMEEEDLSVRLLEQGWTQLSSSWLRIYHDSDLGHHNTPEVTAATIANLALLAWLRYPKLYWSYGLLQVLNRVRYCIGVGRFAGIGRGFALIPGHLWRHRSYRVPVSARAMKLRLEARKSEPVNFDCHRFYPG